MAADYKPYDSSEIDSIRLMLEAEAREGKPLCFEIKVDGATRVHKTNNVQRFEELHNFLNENTAELVISIYPDGKSNRKEWYKYRMNAAPVESLNGVDMEAKISERMKQFEDKLSIQRTEEKLKETEDKLEQAELYIDILEDKLEDQKAKPNHVGAFDLAKLASSTIEGIAIHYPRVLDKVPVLNGIVKVIHEDNKTRPNPMNGTFEGDVSFKPKVKKALSDHQEAVARLSEFIVNHFDESQKPVLGAIIFALGKKPEQLQTVAELLHADVNATMEDDDENEETED